MNPESDMLIHVVDVSHPQFEDHMSVVERTSPTSGVTASQPWSCSTRWICFVTLKEAIFEDLRGIQERYQALGHDILFMSAKTKIGYDELHPPL